MRIKNVGSVVLCGFVLLLGCGASRAPEPIKVGQKVPELPEMAELQKPFFANQDTRTESLRLFVTKYPQWTEKNKIQFLLECLQKSQMTFVRNGSEYTSVQAARWLRWKSMHRQYRSHPIKTAHDFVYRVTDRSKNSGLYYEVVNHNGERMRVFDLMKNELEALEVFLQQTKLQQAIEEESTLESSLQDQLQTSTLVSPTVAA